MWFRNSPADRGARRVFVLLVAACTGTAAPAQMEDYIGFIEAEKLLLSSSGTLYWKGYGPQMPSNQTSIYSLGVDVPPGDRYKEPLLIVSPPSWPERPIR